MAGGIRIEPYEPLNVSTPAMPGAGYIDVDAHAGKFSPSPLLKLSLEIAEGVPAVAGVVAQQLARDDEAVFKAADTRLGETEQALLFDPRTGFFNTEGQDALSQAPTVLDAYREAQEREAGSVSNDAQRRMLAELARRLKIDVDMIERVLRATLEQYKLFYGLTIELDSDFYWTIAGPEKFSVYDMPKPSLGSLADHVERMEEVDGGEDPDSLLLQDIGEILKHLTEAKLDLKGG